MKISYNWLKDYIDLDLRPEELAEILTNTGLEVAGIEKVESIKGGLEGLVTGHVITCDPHPDSDHLSKTTVDTGSEILPVICGAPNVAAGQKVIVATVGTILYDGDKEFVIKKAKIRGEVSQGMICSEIEIGIGNDSSGIIVLPEDTKPGIKARDYYQVEDDYAIEIDLTPNRIDGASHIGAARDIAAYLKLTREIEYKRPSVDHFKTDNHKLEIPVEVLNQDACPRYSGVTLTNVAVKESPDWLKNRLKTIGLNPINNIVDITNYVLFETGHPLHAFDAEEIKGGKVIVRTMEQGTKFVTLDEEERELSNEDLMICNAEDGMCIAGVFGGIQSGVKETTKSIFLESAYFNPLYIRRTARRHGLNTDASFRFERGIDPNGVVYALKRAALLIKEVTSGEISSDIVDIYPDPFPDFKVSLSYKNLTRLTGKELEIQTIKDILNSLEIQITEENNKGLELLVPPYRVDVTREADVIEEILRVYGYNNVGIPETMHLAVQTIDKPNPEKIKNTISELMVSQGFTEIWSNSLTKASYYEESDSFTKENTVTLFNPLSSDLNSMRQTLLFGGLECIAYNSNRQNSDIRLFEFGNCYYYKGTNFSDKPTDNYLEEEHLALFIAGQKEEVNWTMPEQKSTFFELKTYAENILKRMGFNLLELNVSGSDLKYFSDGLKYESENKNSLMQIGIIRTDFQKDFDIENTVYYADFNWNNILIESIKNNIQFRELPKYPSVRRDLALLVDKNVRFLDIQEQAFKVDKKLLRNLNLFDVYEGKGIPEGKKSYAISILLRDDHSTLKNKQIDKIMQKMIDALEKNLNAVLR